MVDGWMMDGIWDMGWDGIDGWDRWDGLDHGQMQRACLFLTSISIGTL